IAHDFNNLLMAVLGNLALLKKRMPEDPRLLRLVDGALQGAERGAALTQRLLAFARRQELRPEPVDLTQLVRGMMGLMERSVGPGVDIVTELPDGLPAALADANQLELALLNLVVNARDAMPGGGRIVILAENMTVDAHYAAMNIESRVGAYVKIEVEDNGSGIPTDIQERVFDPFFTTKPVGEGTGLGLATTLAIVKSHGGFVRMYSEVDKGTRFRIYLPADPQAVGAQSSPPQTTVPRGNGELIMVVDDEAAIRQVTRQTLEAYGYQVIVASNGAEAVALYAQNIQGIALVLTDMMMPVMDGQATIQVLRRMNPKVRIIAASGLNTSGMAAKATQAGVKHFIPKPYTAEILLKTLHQMLHES
ncbi:MAG TPA: hybrid sensor histidine kinase/response regulator, partial [Verrucomicrobiales bacterium]|nr:hybrid sensor histidine kinase/response regulator [Verrucomicrobiales bacterium]